MLHAQLHTRMDHGAKGLAQHGRQAAIDDAWDLALVRRNAALHDLGHLRRGCVERHQRVQANQQIHAIVQRDRCVHGLLQRPVHVVLVVNLDRWKQAGQGRTGLHRLRDRHMVPAGAAKGRSLATVQVGGHQRELGLELAEIVGTAFTAEQACQLRIDRLVGEHASGQAWSQTLQCVH